MATSNSPSQSTVNRIAQQRTAQQTAVTNANDILQSSEFQSKKDNLVPQEQARNEAEIRYRRVLGDLSSTKAQQEAAKNEFIAADDAYRSTVRSLTSDLAAVNNQLAQGRTYGAQQEQTAGVQTTSPPPTFEENQRQAQTVGEAAGRQAPGNPPNIPEQQPVPPGYNPTIETSVDENEVYNALVQNFEQQRPNNNTTTEVRPTPAPVERPVQPPQYVFNQNQINFLEAYNENLIESGNPDLVVDTDSPEALDVLIKRGLIRPDDDGVPVQQNTISRENESQYYNEEGGEGNGLMGPPIEVTISGVGFEEFQDEGFTDEGFEEFQDNVSFGAEERTIPNLPARQQFTAKPAPDWRFRISLAPSASYLYKDSAPGILAPLARTGGVIFPYTPQITVVYAANYNSTELTHSNYKIPSYRSSSVESVSITGDFTAQDSTEANYMLAVIHFFKSVTKMFYGQDNNPARGVPPPLCYLTGFGQYQFDHHPVVITNFTYTMPVDVDYVNAYPTNPSTSIGGVDLSPYNILSGNKLSPLDRLRRLAGKIDVGGTLPAPKFNSSQNINEITRVPSKISLTIQCLPVVTRNTISNQFSLKSYATGALMRGSSNPNTGGGVW